MEENPNIKIEFIDAPELEDDSSIFAAWLSTQVLSGTAPDLIRSWHNVPVQNGWALNISQYLDEPNPYAPQYDRWRDAFYETLMTSLVWENGEEYCAPIRAIYPALEVGLMYNKDYFRENNIPVPSSFTELKEVSKQLKEMGTGLSPWAREAVAAGRASFWVLALQVLVPMLQGIAPEMDLNGDLFIGADEALPAYRKGLIGPKTEIYQRAFREVLELAQYWVDGYNAIDVGSMFKQGELYLQYNVANRFSTWINDPAIEFELGFLPVFIPLPDEIPPMDGQPGAYPPKEITKGDGKVPGEYVYAIQGPDNIIMRESVEKHDNLEETIQWWHFVTTPENGGFLVNENQTHIPAAKDAPLGSIYQDLAQFKVNLYEYSISWWGMGLFWDAASFVKWREIFQAHVLGITDWDTFIDQFEQEFQEGSARYAESLSS